MIARIISLPAVAAALASFLGGHAAPAGSSHIQVPLSASSGSRNQARYDDEQVWRLDWKEMNANTKEDIRTVVEVSLMPYFHPIPQ